MQLKCNGQVTNELSSNTSLMVSNVQQINLGNFINGKRSRKGSRPCLFTGLEWIGCWFAFCDMQMRGDLLRFFQFDGRSGWFLSRMRWTVLAAVQKRLKDAAAGWFAYLVQGAPFPALHERQVDARRIRVGWMEAAAVAGSWATRWRKWAAGDFKIWTSVRRFRRRWTEIGRIVVQKRLVNPAGRFLGDLIQRSLLAAFNKRPVN